MAKTNITFEAVKRLVLPPPNLPGFTKVYYAIGYLYLGLSIAQIEIEGVSSTVPLFCAGDHCISNFSTTGIIVSVFFLALLKRGDGYKAAFETILGGTVLNIILSLENTADRNFYWWSYPLWFCLTAFPLYNMRPISVRLNRWIPLSVVALAAGYVVYLAYFLPLYSWQAVVWEVPQEIVWFVMFYRTVQVKNG